MNNQSIKNHRLYPEYAQMRIREKELLRRQEEIREECAEIEDFKEACQRMISARKKLDYVEKVIREDTAWDNAHKGY